MKISRLSFWVAECGVRGVRCVCVQPMGGEKIFLFSLFLHPCLLDGFAASSALQSPGPWGWTLLSSHLGFASDTQGLGLPHTLLPCMGKGFCTTQRAWTPGVYSSQRVWLRIWCHLSSLTAQGGRNTGFHCQRFGDLWHLQQGYPLCFKLRDGKKLSRVKR